MAKCESCGADLVEGAKFCSSCGAHVSKPVKEEFTISSEDLIGRIKELLREGDVTKIIVKMRKVRFSWRYQLGQGL